MRLALRSLVMTLMGVSLLITPFDCFGTTGLTRQAADCCAKGKCLPNSDSDDCCKRTVPGGHDFDTVSGKTLVHVPAIVHAIAIEQSLSPLLSNEFAAHFELAYSPPDTQPGIRLNLPLLI